VLFYLKPLIYLADYLRYAFSVPMAFHLFIATVSNALYCGKLLEVTTGKPHNC